MSLYLNILLVLLAIIKDFTNGQTCFSVNLSPQNMSGVYPLEKNLSNDSITTPLYFGLMVAPSEDSTYLNTTVTAVQLALDAINTKSDLLKGYSLHYTLTMSQCSEHHLLSDTINQLFGIPGTCKLGLIEAGCTNTRPSVVRTHWANHFNIPEITCSPTTHEKVFATVPMNTVIIPALAELISHYKWKKLGLIVENEVQYRQMTRSLDSLNVTLTVVRVSLSVKNGTFTLKDSCGGSLFNPNLRVFMLAMSSEMAKYLLCEAFKANIQYPKYEFIFVSNHDSDWWVASPQDDLHYGCLSEERARVVNYSLTFQWRPSLSDSYQNRIALLGLNLTNDWHSWYCYDAVQVLALALNKTTSELKGSCIYRNRSLAHGLYENIQQTNFEGQTGRLEFGENGFRNHDMTEVLLQQYQTSGGNSLKLFPVGIHKEGILSLTNDTSLWPGGTPHDGSPAHVLVTVSFPLAMVYYTLASVGLILALACCMFNFIYRKKKVVRLTSPNLNYLIITGVVLTYLATFAYCLPSTNPSVVLTACCFQMWLIAIGYLLALGTIIAKLGRIYFIFRNPESVKKKTITDCHLSVFILCTAALMVTIVSLYVVVEVGIPGYELNKIPSRDHPSEILGDNAVETVYEFYICSRVPYARTLFSGLVVGVIGLFLLCALFMAFKTRKVQIKGLNDAKYITAIVYFSSLVDLISIIIIVSLRSNVNIFPAALSGCFMIAATFVLILVFLPKMVSLYRDPEGKNVFSYKDRYTQADQLSKVMSYNADCTGCQHLQTKINMLESSRNEYDVGNFGDISSGNPPKGGIGLEAFISSVSQ